MTRTIKYIPEIEGCYGMRVWIPASDQDLIAFVRPLCPWGSATDMRFAREKTEYCFELPFGISNNELWQRACKYFRITFVQ